MRLLAPLACLLLGCPSAAPAPADDDDSAPPEPPGLTFLTPGEAAANPVTFTVSAPEGVTSVRYLSQGVTTLGTSEDAEAGFPLTWSFELLGTQTIEAWAFAGDTFVDDATWTFEALPDPREANDFGVWIEEVDSLGAPIDDVAERLAALGVSRVYVPIGEGLTDCVSTPALCDHALTDAFRDRGIAPYAWAVPALGEPMPQAELLFDIVPAGYHGLVLAVDARWGGLDADLDQLALSYVIVRSQCDTSGEHLAGEFPLWAALGSPDALAVGALDERWDGFMPILSGLEVAASVCQLRDLGGLGPVHPVFERASLQDGGLQGALTAAGRRASLRWVPSADDAAGWAALEAVPWSWDAFEEPDCD